MTEVADSLVINIDATSVTLGARKLSFIANKLRELSVRGSWWAGVVTCREELPCCRACHCQDIMCEYGHLNIGIGVRRSYPDVNSFICQKL